MEYVSLYSANKPNKSLEKSVENTDNLSPYELTYRNELISKGADECAILLGKQKDSQTPKKI